MSICFLTQKLEPLLKKYAKKYDVHARVYSEKLGIDYTYFYDGVEKPFNIASISKIFPTVTAFMLIEDGKMKLDDKIANHLPAEMLKDIFVYKGVDYAYIVTVKDLMGNTSGVLDSWEVLADPNKVWTPEMIFDLMRNTETAGKPGECFNYSDVGFNLLAKVIEAVTQKAYSEVLHEQIFEPLNMGDSYIMYHSKPKNGFRAIEKVWYKGHEVSTWKSLSVDFGAGGGIVSTVSDLLKFNIALNSGKLISQDSLQKMRNATNKFRSGMFYGLGMEVIDFTGFFFLLKSYPKLYGHTGIFTTHLYYDPISETHIIFNFGNDKAMEKTFNALIKIGGLIK